MPPPTRKYAEIASAWDRIQNKSVVQTVKASAGILHRMIISNLNAAAQTVTVADDTTVMGVWEIPAHTTIALEFGVAFATSLKITPAVVELDILTLYD